MVHTLISDSLVVRNEAKEAGGNLDSVTLANKQILDLLTAQISLLKGILFQLRQMNGVDSTAFEQDAMVE